VLRREVISESSAIDPESLEFATGERGKPALHRPTGTGLVFNLSHSEGVVALAIARTTAIGIDVEAERPVPKAPRLAQRFLSPAERDHVLAVPAPARDRAFLAVWTRKEAWLKASGRGVSVRLSKVEVEPDIDREPRLLGLPEGCGQPDDWRLVSLGLSVPAVATLCLPAGDWTVDVAQWHPAP
jgi:4'-phosphopantetheinyl transferase